MTHSIKTKLKKTYGQTNIDKFGVAAHKMLLNIISEQKFNLLRH